MTGEASDKKCYDAVERLRTGKSPQPRVCPDAPRFIDGQSSVESRRPDTL
jgi:hypothetical protein